MKEEYYKKSFGKKYPLLEKPVFNAARVLMKENHSWDNLEYIVSREKDDSVYYMTSSVDVNKDFYYLDSLKNSNYTHHLALYVLHDDRAAIIAYRNVSSQPELKKTIKELKDVIESLDKKKVIESIDTVENKWPTLFKEK
jgi:hypothetical protein